MAQPINQVPALSLAQTIANLGQQSKLAAQSTVDPKSIVAGIRSSFAVVTFGGKVWGIRHRGVNEQLLVRDPQTGTVLGTVPYLDMVIVKTASAIAKTFYIKKDWQQGDYGPPDCWSTNGQVPDPAAPKKQSETCRGCQWDRFGSRTSESGIKMKACQDSKRLAVVPINDLRNERYGGPMLLKLPPGSFNPMLDMFTQLNLQGYAYFGVVMRITFDHEATHPRLIFTPIRVLNDHEQQEVINLQTNDVVERILNEELIEVTSDPDQPVEGEQPTSGVAEMGKIVREHVQQPNVAVNAPTGVSVATPVVTTPARAFNPQALPSFLDRTPTPTPLTPEQQEIAKLKAQLAATKSPPEPELTPEQREIAELKAQLAATKAGQGPAVQVTKPVRAKRTQRNVVSPEPTPVQQTGNGQSAVATNNNEYPAGEPIVPDDEAEGDTPPDLDSRIDSLLNPGGPTK